MTYKEAGHDLKSMLSGIYDAREAAHITEWVIEDLTGLSRLDRIMHEGSLSEDQEEKYRLYFARLSDATPVQYVTGYAWFMGERFRVNEDVLIPRPETEELVQWVKEGIKGERREDRGERQEAKGERQDNVGVTLIDIGTGSGCIPIMLKKSFPEVKVHALDVSIDALEVARANASHHHADVIFHKIDFLDESQWASLPMVDIIISNPPYVPLTDKQSMSRHVVDHEPHLALFVPDEDPLLFYRTIIQFAEKKLKPGGMIFFETHHELAGKVMMLAGGRSEVRKDISGKERMVKIMM
ncbi:MAG TPA: peptide chain release factor N(5)-glutamine methyltransferase [Chitinophagaceae bacterium]|nr:peptide chain release factor N(5)-glutamine methyltransferase [Chitinophagaceae bacterium]